jgi:hypothetical protein
MFPYRIQLVAVWKWDHAVQEHALLDGDEDGANEK